MKHLIKRKNLEYSVKEGWRCEVKRNGSPTGTNAQAGEEIYIAQNGYAIFAKGIISEIKEVKQVTSMAELVKYALKESQVKDPLYWMSKLEEYCELEEPFKVFIFEYFISDVEQFDYCIPLDKQFLKQSVWYYLEDDYSFDIPKANNELTMHIPTKVRQEVFHRFNIDAKELIVDVDHFVPKSAGGPGNIIENLVPISPSINRRKSDDIPSKLFDLGKKFNVSVPKGVKVGHDIFYPKKSYAKVVKQIVEAINQQSIEKIRADYNEIRVYHNPAISNY